MPNLPERVADPLRLAALDARAILNTPAEESFDDAVRLAARLCAAPVALVSFVAADRQWFKARIGFSYCETDLNSSVCQYALAEPDLLIIPDLTADPRTATNPLVTGAPHIRFYAGAPLRTPEGHVLGSLCVIDTVARPTGLTAEQSDDLRALGRQVSGLVELRRVLAEREALITEQQSVIREREAYACTLATISSSDGDLDLVLDAVLAGAMEALPSAEGGTIELVEGDTLQYRTVRGSLVPHSGLRVPLLGSTSGACARNNAPILLRDARDDPRVKRDLASVIDLRSAVHAPITHAGQVLGVLKLQASTPGAFSQRDLEMVQRFAAAAAAGLTEAREAAAQRAYSTIEGRYQAIFESAIDYAIVVTDLDGRVTQWSAGATRILGWSAQEMVGQAVGKFFTPEDLAEGVPQREMRDALATGRGADERWHIRKTGERFWASGELMVLRDEGGAAIGYVKMLRDRTADHLAARALEAAEVRLRQAQEAGGVGLFTVDVATNVLTPTPEFCRLYGLPVQAQCSASEIEERVIHEDHHLVSTSASRSRGEAQREVEYRVRLPGTDALRWIARTGEIEFDGEGRPVRFFGVARDITAARAARDALARSEERYRALFEAVDDGFCIIEFFDGPHGPLSDYVHVEANPGYERQTGIPGILGQTIRGLAPAEADGWVELYGKVLRTGQPIRFERFFALADRYIEVSAARIEPASRRQVSVLFRDITERRRAETALRASEAVAQENIQRVQLALAAGAIIGTWFWDLPTDRFTVDEAFARAFGLDPALGREGIPLAQIVATVHPEDQADLAAAISEAIARGGAYAHQYRTRRADGNYYWLEANGRVDHALDGTPLSFPGVLLDIEQRRTVEAERDRAAAELRSLNETLEQQITERTAELMHAEESLRQSQKMEAVGQLTGGLAHDFNNLLTGVTGSLELLQTRIAQGRIKDVDRYVNAAQGAAKRAAALTHRLLAFSRRQTLDSKATDVNRLVHGMEELIRRTVGPAITVEPLVGAGGLWPILVDAGQLENALLNLCINARDAMPDGGKITIETGNRWLDKRTAAERDLPPGQYVSLCVSDTGTGMPADVVAKAFDPFFTTKPMGQGTGLGLSMIYGFAKQSGGQARIYSEVGQGTMVCLYLPRHLGEAETAELAPELADAPRAEVGQTVLVVDDEPTVRMLVTEVLEDLGYRAIEATDGAAGLQILQSDVRVDLLVTDVGLPGGMNGRQVADAARVARPDLKVLFITGYAENAVVSHGHLEPGMHVLTKPFAMESLASRIKELISR